MPELKQADSQVQTPPPSPWWPAVFRVIDWAVAVLLTGVAVFLHARFLLRAGPFWRDECSGVAVATLASLSEVWSSLAYESFPVLPFLLMRLWWLVGLGGSDMQWRVLGLLVGVGIVAALWLNKRLVAGSVPVLLLALVAFNPALVRWGDSIRGYGLGTLLIVLSFGFFFKLTQSPGLLWGILAGVCSLLAVQSMYQSAVLLFAIGLGAMAVCIVRRRWKAALWCCGIGVVCAVSLVPYLPTVRQNQEFMVVVKREIPFDHYQTVLEHSLTGSEYPAGPAEYSGLPGWFANHATFMGTLTCIWVILWGFAVMVGAGALLPTVRRRLNLQQRDLGVYGLVVLAGAPLAFFGFLSRLSFPTRPWYYVIFIALIGLAIAAVLALLEGRLAWRMARAVVAIGIVLLLFRPLYAQTGIRHTNVDQIAAELEKRAGGEDLIVVNQFYHGITLNRYYQGDATVMSLPPLEDLRIHRYDQLKEKLEAPDKAVDPLLSRMAQALRTGGAVYVIGNLHLPQGRPAPPFPLPAPLGPQGWWWGPYKVYWNYLFVSFIENYARQAGPLDLDMVEVKIPDSQRVYSLERPMLIRISRRR